MLSPRRPSDATRPPTPGKEEEEEEEEEEGIFKADAVNARRKKSMGVLNYAS